MRFAAFALLALSSVAVQAQLYRWTDSTGRTHVTDTPPPSDAKGVQKRASSAPAEESSNEPYALRQAMKDYPVTLYTLASCDGCTQARKLLNARGIPFAEKTVESEEQLKKATGATGVPALLVGSDIVTGFEAGAYNRSLDAAGYPRAGILKPRNQQPPAPPKGQAQAPAAQAPAAPPAAPRGRYATPQ
jgi:glutaredoxin